MDFILSVISLFAGIAGALGIYVICRNNKLKRRDGKFIVGKKVSCEERTGRPTRYIVEAEIELNGKTYLKKIVTADKKIKKYADNEEIPLLYVDTIDKVFWYEDNSYEWIVCIVLLIAFCIFMFQLSGICLAQHLTRMTQRPAYGGEREIINCMVEWYPEDFMAK